MLKRNDTAPFDLLAWLEGATQAVGGEGDEASPLMLVGEQPGDKEGKDGKGGKGGTVGGMDGHTEFLTYNSFYSQATNDPNRNDIWIATDTASGR